MLSKHLLQLALGYCCCFWKRSDTPQYTTWNNLDAFWQMINYARIIFWNVFQSVPFIFASNHASFIWCGSAGKSLYSALWPLPAAAAAAVEIHLCNPGDTLVFYAGTGQWKRRQCSDVALMLIYLAECLILKAEPGLYWSSACSGEPPHRANLAPTSHGPWCDFCVAMCNVMSHKERIAKHLQCHNTARADVFPTTEFHSKRNYAYVVKATIFRVPARMRIRCGPLDAFPITREKIDNSARLAYLPSLSGSAPLFRGVLRCGILSRSCGMEYFRKIGKTTNIDLWKS